MYVYLGAVNSSKSSWTEWSCILLNSNLVQKLSQLSFSQRDSI